MTHRSRVFSSVAMAVVLMVLPLATVVCDLRCPEVVAAAAESGRASSPSRVAAAHGSPSCHDVSPGPPADDGVGGAVAPRPASGLGASRDHACEHPRLLSPRVGQSLRVPQPSVTVWDVARDESAVRAAQSLTSTRVALRAPVPHPGPAFSPVLRI